MDHLLRTFAAVPFGQRVLDLSCGEGHRTLALVQLGFDVYACDPGPSAVAAARAQVAPLVGADEAARRITPAHPGALGYPDDFFDWVVACDAVDHLHTREALGEALAEARRVLRDGGWIYVTVPSVPAAVDLAAPGYAGDSGMPLRFTPETLRAVFEAAGFAEAQAPTTSGPAGAPILQAIYRRVGPSTPP